MNTSEFRVLAKHCFLIGRNIDQTKEWLDQKYSESAPAYSTIEGWFVDFHRDHTPNTRSKRANETQAHSVNKTKTKKK